jgi:hypothetical protein
MWNNKGGREGETSENNERRKEEDKEEHGKARKGKKRQEGLAVLVPCTRQPTTFWKLFSFALVKLDRQFGAHASKERRSGRSSIAHCAGANTWRPAVA